jgi:general secretion pathway protein K
LVTVLWTIALLSTLAIATALTFQGFAGVMSIDRSRVQADGVLQAGLEVAAGLVASAGDKPLVDVESTLTLSSGELRLRIDDEGGRVDIGRAPAQLLAAVLQAAGAPDPDGLARQIVEWRKLNAGDVPAPVAPSTNSANLPAPSTPATVAQSPAQPTLNAAFSDISQLLQVPDMRPEWVAAAKPLITVFGNETINPLTAPAEVLAILPGVDQGRLAGFLQARHSAIDPQQLVAQLGAVQAYVAVKPPQAVRVRLVARLADGSRANAEAVIVCLPGDSQPYRVLVWNPLPSPQSWSEVTVLGDQTHADSD